MPPPPVRRVCEAVRVLTLKRLECRLDANHLARRQPIPAVEDASLGVEHDRLQKPTLFDVGRKLVELMTIF